jgi:ubiquinone/menaquinone biosynthesis C-methylase UbiE
MKVWIGRAEENLNTPSYYDEVIWAKATAGRWDSGRSGAFAKVIRSGDLVLDAGAGCFGMAQWAAMHWPAEAAYVALDFSVKAKSRVMDEMGMAGYPNFTYKIGNVLEMPFEGDLFDVVFAGELIEHFEHPAELVSELVRVCKPGGTVVVSTVDPYCEDSIRNGCSYREHLVEFTKEDLLELFETCGETVYERVGNYHMIFCRKTP